MTEGQIKFQQLQENWRHNKAMEVLGAQENTIRAKEAQTKATLGKYQASAYKAQSLKDFAEFGRYEDNSYAQRLERYAKAAKDIIGSVLGVGALFS